VRKAALFLSVALAASGLPAKSANVPAASAQPSLLEYLNQAIAWYRGFATLAPLATEPPEVLVYNDARHTALEVLRLAFEFARADVPLLQTAPPAAASEQPASPNRLNPQVIARLAAEAAVRVKQAEAEVDRLRGQLSRASSRGRRTLERQLAEAQSELQLARARKEAIDALASFVAQGGAGAGSGLLEQIAALERTVPELHGNASNAAPPAALAVAAARRSGDPASWLFSPSCSRSSASNARCGTQTRRRQRCGSASSDSGRPWWRTSAPRCKRAIGSPRRSNRRIPAC